LIASGRDMVDRTTSRPGHEFHAGRGKCRPADFTSDVATVCGRPRRRGRHACRAGWSRRCALYQRLL